MFIFHNIDDNKRYDLDINLLLLECTTQNTVAIPQLPGQADLGQRQSYRTTGV